MAKDRTVDRKELYRMICALSDADVQKAVSYVSFLRFVDVSEGKDIMELLKVEPSAESESMIPSTPCSVDAPVLVEPEVLAPVEPVRTEGFHGTPDAEPVAEVPVSKVEEPEIEASKPSEPEAGVSKNDASGSAELFDVGDFYTPVRSPRLEQASETEEPKQASAAPVGEPIIPRLMRELEQTVHSIFEPNREPTPSRPAREQEESLPSLFEPLDYEHHEPAPLVASEPEPAAPAPSEPARSTFAPRDHAEDFFMPVRSQRFDQLRRPEESEPAPVSAPKTEVRRPEPEPEIVIPRSPRRHHHDESHELSMFVAEPEPVQLPTPGEEKPRTSPGADVAVASMPEPVGPSEEERKAALMRERLRRLLTSFRLTYGEVANLFDAPVSVVYSWFEGVLWDSGQEAKLEYFLEVADRVAQNGIPRPDLVVHRPFASGETFLDKLKRQKVTGQDLKTLKDVATRAEELRHKLKGASRPFYPFEEAINLYSTPLYGEAE